MNHSVKWDFKIVFCQTGKSEQKAPIGIELEGFFGSKKGSSFRTSPTKVITLCPIPTAVTSTST